MFSISWPLCQLIRRCANIIVFQREQITKIETDFAIFTCIDNHVVTCDTQVEIELHSNQLISN